MSEEAGVELAGLARFKDSVMDLRFRASSHTAS